jgi:predicted nucleotidyltransferase
MRRDSEARTPGPFPAVAREAITAAAEAMADAYPWVEAVYLFGSRARGGARPSSDIDLAVLPCPTQAPADRIAAEAELARFAEDRLEVPVDVVLIRRDLSPGLLFDIFSVETILFARAGAGPPGRLPGARRVSRPAPAPGASLSAGAAPDRGAC